MTFQTIRAYLGPRWTTAFQTLVPPIEVVFDNVQKHPCPSLRRLLDFLHQHC